MELIQQFAWVFHIILIILAVMLILCLIRAIIGPRIADRLMAINMISTMVMVIIAILAVVMNEGYLIDICLIYAMISFLAVVVLTKIYTGVYLESKEQRQESKDLRQGSMDSEGDRAEREKIEVKKGGLDHGIH